MAGGAPVAKLLEGLTAAPMAKELRVTGLSLDSRRVQKDDLFLACRGERVHGGAFVKDAARAGARAVAIDAALAPGLEECRLPVFPVSDLRSKSSLIAGRFYGHPSDKLKAVGVTGTNGKTSVAFWSAQLYAALAGKPAGLSGTLGSGLYPDLQPGLNTTPDPVALQGLLSRFAAEGVEAVFMEVSSHALHQGRVEGVRFAVAAFTNLSPEHLDYHGDLRTYAAAKKKLFLFETLQGAVVNHDDECGRQILRRLPETMETISYGLSGAAGLETEGEHPLLRARVATDSQGNISLAVSSPWGSGKINTRVAGRFNAANLLAAIGIMRLLGFPWDDIMEQAGELSSPPGRMERLAGRDGEQIVIDYAHSPAALEQALDSARAFCDGRLICVFGCGGNRDRAKRGPMGKLAETLSDEVILTDDNPRDEPSEAIIADILAGMGDADKALIENNRAKAIALALGRAGPGDVVLIAGKGHETSQDIAGVRHPFNDAAQVRQCLGSAG